MTMDANVAVPQLLYRYARALDRLDPALLDEVFAEDAVIEMGSIFSGGRAAFASVAAAFMGSMVATRHEIGNILIESNGDAAAFEAYVTAWHRIDGGGATQELVVRARYLGRAERRAGRWWLVAHSEVMDWGSLTPADAGWYEANDELPKGRRDAGDASCALLPRAG